jgi:hypothetical protein
VVAIVPATLVCNRSTQLEKTPPNVIQSMDGDAVAEVLDCIHKKMEVRVTMTRDDEGSNAKDRAALR